MLKQIKNNSILTTIVLAVVAFSFVVTIPSTYATPISDSTKEKQQPLLSIVSTRNISDVGFDMPQLTKLVDNTVTKFNGPPCPTEIAIYIHGFNKDKDDAGEEFNRIQTSLNINNSTIPLIGFSWDSNVLWEQAKVNAKKSGEELTKFIFVFKNECSNTDIRIIAHSLGAAVVDSTLSNLVKYLDSNNNNISKIIKSIHLLGAAINNELITEKTAFGKAINYTVGKFFNLYNPEDDGLEINRFFEKHNPLGAVGAPKQNTLKNYYDTNVINEIPALSDADGDGNLEECFEENGLALVKGDNHCGYIGFREPFSNSLLDDGAINIVVRDWINS